MFMEPTIHNNNSLQVWAEKAERLSGKLAKGFLLGTVTSVGMMKGAALIDSIYRVIYIRILHMPIYFVDPSTFFLTSKTVVDFTNTLFPIAKTITASLFTAYLITGIVHYYLTPSEERQPLAIWKDVGRCCQISVHYLYHLNDKYWHSNTMENALLNASKSLPGIPFYL